MALKTVSSEQLRLSLLIHGKEKLEYLHRLAVAKVAELGIDLAATTEIQDGLIGEVTPVYLPFSPAPGDPDQIAFDSQAYAGWVKSLTLPPDNASDSEKKLIAEQHKLLARAVLTLKQRFG